MKKIVYLAGPTASGKTALSLKIAEDYKGEIVSCDSMQIYRRLDIGTAKPTSDERRSAPHWMLDILEPEQSFSVYDYVTKATSIISGIQERGMLPIVCGGTGLYMSALLHDHEYTDLVADVGLHERIESEYLSPGGPEQLLEEIRNANPEHAGKLFPNDRKRIVRAVELLRMTGSTYSFQPEMLHTEESSGRVCILMTVSDRSILYDRIHRRVDSMMESGLLEEAELVFRNRERYRTAAAAIGYKEFFPYFEGKMSLEDCVGELKKATRHYAKRQLTWFRKEKEFVPVFIDQCDSAELYSTVKVLLEKGLAT